MIVNLTYVLQYIPSSFELKKHASEAKQFAVIHRGKSSGSLGLLLVSNIVALGAAYYVIF